MKTNLKFLMIAFLAIMTACSPEDGKDGIDGADGEQGIQGDSGEDGQDGNANVTSYLFEYINLEPGRRTFPIPAITNDILQNGAVLAYSRNLYYNEWFPLPINYQNGTYIKILLIKEGNVEIESTSVFQQLHFRFVVIEGSAGNRSSKRSETIFKELKKDGIDINDYNAVANYYNLQN